MLKRAVHRDIVLENPRSFADRVTAARATFQIFSVQQRSDTHLAIGLLDAEGENAAAIDRLLSARTFQVPEQFDQSGGKELAVLHFFDGLVHIRKSQRECSGLACD